MSLLAPVKDGEIVSNTASSNSVNKSEKNSSGVDADSFLTLLVAEMQNQDPLEPSSNTEWISQYATFTEVSEIQSIGGNIDQMSAQGLVGKYAIMKVTDSATGNTDYVTGKVDYVSYEPEDTFLYIDGKPYSLSDLDTVASNEYMDAYNLAAEVVENFNDLPSLDNLTIGYRDKVYELYDKVSNMTAYEKTFVKKDFVDAVSEYYERMNRLVEKANASGNSSNKTDDNKTEEKEDTL